MRRLAAALAAGLIAAFAGAGVPAATAQPLPAAKTCDGVWVVVDFGELGGISTQCATDFSTGTKALKSAGFSPTITGGFLDKIDGLPKKPDANKAYWSYWHAELKADGSFGDWEYSTLGAGDYHPTRGNADGWRYQNLSDGKVSPGAKPPTAEPQPTEKPKPSETPKPKPSETEKPKPSETAKPSSSPKPTATPSPTRTPSPSTTPTPSPTPTPSITQSPTAEPTPTESATATVTPTSEASASPAPEPGPDSGSPVAAIVAGILVVAGGGGAGLWWWLKGRQR